MSDMKNLLKKYYENERIKEMLIYEINLFNKIIEDLEKFRCINEEKNLLVEEKVNEIKSKILAKQIEINEISQKYVAVEYALQLIDQEDREIIRNIYGRSKKYCAVSLKFNISKSALSRRMTKVLSEIEVYV